MHEYFTSRPVCDVYFKLNTVQTPFLLFIKGKKKMVIIDSNNTGWAGFFYLFFLIFLQMSSTLGLNATNPAALMANVAQEALPLMEEVRD